MWRLVTAFRGEAAGGIMFSVEEVDKALEVARSSLVLLAELVVKGQRTRGEAYERALAEHEALVSLLEEAPASEHGRIHDLLLRYDLMMRSLAN